MQSDKAGYAEVFENKKLIIDRFFTKNLKGNIFDSIEWETRDAVIQNAKEEIIFEQKEVEFPKFWSQLATINSSSLFINSFANMTEDAGPSVK